MGTYFKDLKPPWTMIRCEDNPRHSKITVWDNGANAGTITVDTESKHEALASFFETSDAVKQVAAKDGLGLVIIREPSSDCLLSEYGDLESYAKLKSESPTLTPIESLENEPIASLHFHTVQLH